MEVKGTKIGFLGYCDSPSVYKNCTEMRMLFKSGPAIYRDDIARRDVKSLREVQQEINDFVVERTALNFLEFVPPHDYFDQLQGCSIVQLLTSEKARVLLVFTHVTRRTCWMATVLHNDKV